MSGTGRVAGKVVLVTGGAGAQGAAEARRLTQEGATVVISDLPGEAGPTVAAEIGGGCRFVAHDVADDRQWQQVLADVLDAHGRLDALVHNAAVFRPCPIAETSAEAYLDTVRVNQLGTFLAIKRCAEAMGPTGGSIVLLSSVAGLMGTPGVIAYSSTKWAVRGMAKVAALELAAQGIRVNSVHPGAVDTPMIAAVHERPGGIDEVLRNIPAGRLATADDITALVLFLVSDDATYCTGAEFVIDGGMTAGQARGGER